jgi:hypothetical protein
MIFQGVQPARQILPCTRYLHRRCLRLRGSTWRNGDVESGQHNVDAISALTGVRSEMSMTMSYNKSSIKHIRYFSKIIVTEDIFNVSCLEDERGSKCNGWKILVDNSCSSGGAPIDVYAMNAQVQWSTKLSKEVVQTDLTIQNRITTFCEILFSR